MGESGGELYGWENGGNYIVDWWRAIWEEGEELYGRESQTDKNGFPAPVENQERPFPSANLYNGLTSLQ